VDRAGTELASPARTLVMGPDDAPAASAWTPLGGILGETGAGAKPIAPNASPLGDLFFPKPFNDEQIEIVRRLEALDGVEVQGPPGTCKPHTIANVICHMMATGRRVLVVSHGEPALAVLRDQLPSSVRDLAISITATEREGFRQLEAGLRLLQAILSELKPGEQRRIIRDLVRIRTPDELALAEEALAALADLRRAHRLVEARPWLEPIAAAEMAGTEAGGLGAALRGFVADARAVLGERGRFLARPVETPLEFVPSTEVIGASTRSRRAATRSGC
jgi:hypothetical protein